MRELASRGGCFGFRVHSALDFNFLRVAEEGEVLEVLADEGDEVEPPSAPPLLEWRPPSNPTHVQVFSEGPRFRIWFDGVGPYEIDPAGRRVVVPRHAESIRREERLWGLPALLCLLARGDVPLHAASVDLGGRALLLAAPSRLGKTTLAAAFTHRGYRLLSEDLSCVRLGERPSVIPGPAMLRIRHDVAEAFSPDGAEELARDEDRVHLAIRAFRGDCRPVPLAAVIFLNEGDTDPTVEAVQGAEAVRNLWSVSFNLPTDEDRARLFRTLAALTGATRTWSLTRRLALADLDATVDCLVGAFDTQD